MKKSGEIPTMFPKGTIVKFNGIPCELLQDTPYYSETFKGGQEDSADKCPLCHGSGKAIGDHDIEEYYVVKDE
jgi:hypothetical protein